MESERYKRNYLEGHEQFLRIWWRKADNPLRANAAIGEEFRVTRERVRQVVSNRNRYEKLLEYLEMTDAEARAAVGTEPVSIRRESYDFTTGDAGITHCR